MKRNWFWFLLFGLVLGFALGVASSARFSRPAVPKGTALLRDFSLAAVAAKAGQTNWQVIEDRIYEPFPALARSKRIARRIIARANVADGAFDLFTTQFQQAASAALVAHGALNEAQFDQVQDSTRVVDGSPIRSRLDLPRRYYGIGDIHGVADIWYVAESGRVTVIVSLIEGR
jgi:hypothetical protein